MEDKKQFLTLPGAVIIAGAIIAIAIIYVMKPEGSKVAKNSNQDQVVNQVTVAPINSKDSILGNPNAPIKIIEYSDPSCPYCKVFNTTMTEIMDVYGPTGQVAWVYRHFPLDTPDENGRVLHPNAGKESRAIECARIVGSNDKFWQYEKKLYETTPSVTGETPNGLDPSKLPLIAKEIGLDTVKFLECVDSEEAKKKVGADTLSGNNANVTGTPTNFIILGKAINPTAVNYIESALVQYRIPDSLLYVTDDKKTIVMAGAMPKALIVGLIESLLK